MELSVTEEELKIILESLLSTCCLDVSHRGYREDVCKIKDLAINLRKKHQHIFTDNVFITNTNNLWCEYSPILLEYFPELENN